MREIQIGLAYQGLPITDQAARRYWSSSMGARSHDVNSSANLGRSSDLVQLGRFGGSTMVNLKSCEVQIQRGCSCST